MRKTQILFLLTTCLTSSFLWSCSDSPSEVNDNDFRFTSSSSIKEISSSTTVSSSSPNGPKHTDDEFINMGGQLWTKKNLNLDNEGGSCYGGNLENCEKFGKLYTWTEAMKIAPDYENKELGKIKLPHQGICPEGTHLPSYAEWDLLKQYLEANPENKKYFANPLGGYYRYNMGFQNLDKEAIYWSSTEYDFSGDPEENKLSYGFRYAWLWVYRSNLSIGNNNSHKGCAAYIRCIKDGSEIAIESSSSKKSSSSTTVSSSSQKTAKTTDDGFVNLGGQQWAIKNLDIETEGSSCYDDDPANCDKFGRLYTWSTAMQIDSRYADNELGEIDLPHQGICPQGSHLPSYAEWEELNQYLQANPDDKQYFVDPLGGYYQYQEGYQNKDQQAIYWSSTEYDFSGDPPKNILSYGYRYAWLWVYRKNLSIGKNNSHKRCAAYVRCVKDDPNMVKSSSSRKSSSSMASSSSFVYQADADSIKIGGQVWMTRNLNIPVEGSMCFDNKETNCEKYGRLYTWSQAMGVDSMFNQERLGPLYMPHQGICPEGSHLPSNREWEDLYFALNKAPEYKAYFMNQMGGVFDYNGNFRSTEEENSFWTSTEYNTIGTGRAFRYAWLWAFHADSSLNDDNSQKITGAYVRCIKGAAASAPKNSDSIVLDKAAGCENAERSNWKYLNPAIEYGCIKDSRDGKFYKTVVLGNRIWMAENLRYISQKSSWCYNNETDEECNEYGRYYSGYAISESPSICPEGFHVPTSSEANQLGSYTRSSLMSVEGWKKEYNTFVGNNSTGFTLLPAGLRGYGNERGWKTGVFDGVGNVARFWSSSPYNGSGYYEYVFMNVDDDFGMTDKDHGFGIPVRCIKDSP